MSSGDEMVYVKPEDATAFVVRLLVAEGVPQQDARTTAECLVLADLRGVDSHGLMRLPVYLDRLRRGLVAAAPELRIEQVTPVVAALDGQNGLGFVVATRAMAEALHMASEYGLGMVSARRSTHFGMASCYVLQAIHAGYVAMVFTNASRAMPPWGGREALLGTSPLAVGVPAGSRVPFVLDMSPAVAARGKVRKAARRGETLPEGYALDADGVPTVDPEAALKGVMLPIGGPKGSGLSMLMDILGGVLSGAAFGGDVRDQTKDFDAPQNVGHLFLAIKPDLFVPADEFRSRMDTLCDRVHANPPAAGFSEVLMPGELEGRREQLARITGISLSRDDVATLEREASRVGVEGLTTSPSAFGPQQLEAS